jgi:PAS domain S-box-containing protein
MRDTDKSKEQLIQELTELRREAARLASLTGEQPRLEVGQTPDAQDFRHIVLSINDHTYVSTISEDGYHTNIYLSPQVEALTGYEATKLIADWHFWPSNLIHSDDRTAARTQATRLAKGENSEVEYRLERADGKSIWVRDSARVETNGSTKIIYGVISDISERKQLEERLIGIHQLERELHLMRDEVEIIERVLETTAALLPFVSVGYGRVNQAAGVLAYYYRSLDGPTKSIDLSLALGQAGPIDLTVANEAALLDVFAAVPEVGYISITAERQGRQWLNASVRFGTQIIGMLNVESFEPNSFTPNDHRLVRTLADQAGAAIENARLYDEIRQRVEELTALSMISQAITSTLDLQETLTTVTDHAIRLLDAMAASVTLRDAVRGELWFEAVSGPSAESVREVRLDRKQGIVGWVIEHGEPVLVHDVAEDARFFAGVDQQSGFTTRSILCIPLQTRDQTIGAIEVINKRSGPFDQRDLRLINWLAMPTITAIENARLFEAEHTAREQAERLREATSTLTSTLDLDQVLNRILIHLEQVIPYDSARVFLCEREWLQVVVGRGLSLIEEGVVGRRYPADNALYQQIRSTRHPITVTDTHTDPRFQGWDDMKTIRGWMGVPLMVRSEVIGYLTLESRQVGTYDRVEAELAQAFANQAAVAIQNAQLFEQGRVGQARLQSLSRRLVEVQESERRHVARELHDEAGQALTSLMVGLRLLERDVDCPDSVLSRVGELKHMTNEVLENLHRLAMDLRPASLDHLGLVAALRQYIEAFDRQHHLTVEFEAVGLDDQRLSPAVETNLYRIVQEALTNVIRHAQATHVGVLLKRRRDQIVTIVEDNGVGFEPKEVVQSARLGLLGMRERAEMLGGTLTVESAAGTGTTIFVEAPYVYSHSHR